MLYEATLAYTYNGQQCINRWHYALTGTAAAVSGSFALAHAFGAIYDIAIPGYPANTILNNLQQAVADSVSYEQLTVIALYDDLDFYQAPFVQPYNGSGGAAGEPNFVAVGFRTNQVRRDIRRGYKRFAGVPSSEVNVDGSLGTTYMSTLIEPLAVKMSEALTYDDEGNTLTFSPCIVSKQSTPKAGTVPQTYEYAYYETLVEQMEHVALGIDWQPYDFVRSQVSRQYGRGQ